MNRNRTINMSILSLAGHCIMAATGTYSTNVTIMAFRSRIHANHIWDANLRTANVSREKRRVFENKKNLHGKGEAIAAGRRIIAALVRRQRPQGTQIGRRSHLSHRGSSRLGYNLSPVPPKPKQEWNRKDDLQCEKYGKNEEKHTGYTADDDNKVPAQTDPNMHITDQREIRGRSYYYYKHALWFILLSLILSMPWIAVILVWNSTSAS